MYSSFGSTEWREYTLRWRVGSPPPPPLISFVIFVQAKQRLWVSGALVQWDLHIRYTLTVLVPVLTVNWCSVNDCISLQEDHLNISILYSLIFITTFSILSCRNPTANWPKHKWRNNKIVYIWQVLGWSTLGLTSGVAAVTSELSLSLPLSSVPFWVLVLSSGQDLATKTPDSHVF